MDLVLHRHQFLPTGIFGSLVSIDKIIATTLEHAFSNSAGWAPIVPIGTYACVRGKHQLEGMKEPFETFEVTGVPGHTGILFHVGNYNRDSSGCILVGLAMVGDGQEKMISGSREAFKEFMNLQRFVDSFQLTASEDSPPG